VFVDFAPIFLYSNVVYFPSLTWAEFRRLELAFNACTWYVYGLRLFDHILEFSKGIWGCTLFEYLELLLASFIHKIVGAPDYLNSRLVLGRSTRHRFLVIPNPIPVTSLRGDLALYRGIHLWNMCCLLPLSPLLVLVILGGKQSGF
jgi:hypothetical protein